MADWYVYQHDGDPLGPWSTDVVANDILSGKLAPDVWVAAPGGPRWLRALDVPVIGRLVEGIPTRPRRDSGLRLMPRAAFAATMLSPVHGEPDASDEPVLVGSNAEAPPTTRNDDDATVIATDEEPPTDPNLPPSSTTPSLPPAGTRVDARADENAVVERGAARRRRRGG